jgi:hypothetical protein
MSLKAGRAWRFCFLLLGITRLAHAVPFHGYVYEAGTGRKEPVFKLKRTETPESDGSLLISGQYTTLDGRDVVREDAWVKQGRLYKYVQEQRQLGEWGVMESRDGRLHFSWSNGSKSEGGEEAVPPNLIVGATSIDYLAQHWNELLAGKDVNVRLAVLDHQETVGFKFYATGEGTRAGKDVVYVTLKPTSFFVSLMVKPIQMIFDKTSARILELRGSVGLKKRSGAGWKDLDAEMVYLYDDGAVSPPQR